MNKLVYRFAATRYPDIFTYANVFEKSYFMQISAE